MDKQDFRDEEGCCGASSPNNASRCIGYQSTPWVDMVWCIHCEDDNNFKCTRPEEEEANNG